MEKIEKKKNNKLNLSTILLIIALIVIAILLKDKLQINTNNISESDNKVSNFQESNNGNLINTNDSSEAVSNTTTRAENNNSTDANASNKTVTGTTTNAENIKVDSKYGKGIESYISKIWSGPEAYTDCIAEFQNIKDAPKSYLATCAAFSVMGKVGDDIYGAKAKFNEFNLALIELFGNDADGLISTSDIEKIFFVEKNSDGTYHFMGFDGSETNSTSYIINKIEKSGNIFNVTQYEYKTITDDMILNLENGESTTSKIYDRNDKLILRTTIKAVTKANQTSYKEYTSDGKEIDSIEDILITKYKDKLSVRNIKLEYNESNNSYIMLSNELKK